MKAVRRFNQKILQLCVVDNKDIWMERAYQLGGDKINDFNLKDCLRSPLQTVTST